MIMRRSKFTIEFNKRYGDKVKDRKKSTLAKYFKIPIKLLDTIFDRGLAAARNTGMRPGVTSPSQWARARLTKFILNVEDVRGGKAINKGRGQDGDIVELAVNKNNKTNNIMSLTLRKSKRDGKKWLVKREGKTVHFGQDGARDYTLMSSKGSQFYLADKKERDKVKDAYQARHKGDNLNDPYSPGSLSYYLLWTAPTLRGGIRNYEKRFGVKIVI